MEQQAQHLVWVHPEKARYYQVYLERDLFGDWTLRQVWGGLHSGRGGRMRHSGVASHAAGLEKIDEIAKLRARHGYETIEG